MPKVKCVVQNCAHNIRGESCNAGKIDIKGIDAQAEEYTDCGTFIQRGGMSTIQSWSNINLGGVLMSSFGGSQDQLNPRVTCVVQSCRFHGEDHTCTADTIDVRNKESFSTEMTRCSTYEKRK